MRMDYYCPTLMWPDMGLLYHSLYDVVRFLTDLIWCSKGIRDVFSCPFDSGPLSGELGCYLVILGIRAS